MSFQLLSLIPPPSLILKLEQNWIQLVWIGRGTGPWSPDRRTFSGVRFLPQQWPCSQTSPQQHPRLQSYPTEWPNLEQIGGRCQNYFLVSFLILGHHTYKFAASLLPWPLLDQMEEMHQNSLSGKCLYLRTLWNYSKTPHILASYNCGPHPPQKLPHFLSTEAFICWCFTYHIYLGIHLSVSVHKSSPWRSLRTHNYSVQHCLVHWSLRRTQQTSPEPYIGSCSSCPDVLFQAL